MMTGIQEELKEGIVSDPMNTIQEDTLKIEGTFNGLPYKGPQIFLKNTDSESKLPQLCKKLHIKRFDMSKEEHVKEYEDICQALTDGTAQLSVEKIEYVPNSTNWVILMRWIELWYGPPKES